MSRLRTLLTRRPNDDLPTQPEIPDDMTQWSYVMREAADAFHRGEHNEAIQHLAHAAYVGVVRKEDVPHDEAVKRVRQVTAAGWKWERTGAA